MEEPRTHMKLEVSLFPDRESIQAPPEHKPLASPLYKASSI
jgi:hypothetical protein